MIGLPLSLWLIGLWKLVYGVPVIVIGLLCLPLITAVLTIKLTLLTLSVWINKKRFLNKQSSPKISSLMHYYLINLAALIFVPFLAYWNLLGFQF
ncbi:hypothetical protein WA1_00425 [Scytonema hofmannii PCC 7110]|uniref:Uncharacterized protein n=1 Tax=Scytonema hofmannii PCC 7110 TaxID=128403 RepID=A0A139XG73_9CYAN|nr:hypothetical protein WA1_00425 [Scytonema hofmannii PCC 7110]